MIRLLCATGNRGKLREFQAIAAAFSAGISIGLLPGFESIPPCVEDGATFADNASLKARYYGAHTSEPLFADDSGLEVDALGGAPGVISARYSGPGASDQSNNRLLLENLRGVRNRSARFTCVIALARHDRILGLYTASVEGVILDEPRGAGGFGYDPLFYYPPFGCTFGEATEEQKSEASHRGQAVRKMLAALV